MDNSKDNRLFRSVSRGLTNKEIKKIQRLHSQGDVKDHTIRIAYTVPFAPFMFLGVLVTLLCKGNIIFYVYMVLEKFI